MNINLPAVIAFTVGNVFVYAAVKNKDPRDVVKEALGIIPPGSGAPLVPPSGGSGGGNPLGALGNAGRQAGNRLNPANAPNQNQGFLNPSTAGHSVGNAIGAAGNVGLRAAGLVNRGVNAVGHAVSAVGHAIGHLFGH